MIVRFLRESLFQLVVGLAVTSTVAVFAVINKIWSWPNAIVGGALLMSAFLYLMEKLGIGPSTKSRVRNWLDDSGYSVQTVNDGKEIHFVMTDNIGMKTDIIQVKTGDPIAIISAGHKASAQQAATFNAMNETQRREFWKTVRLELLRYGSGVSFSDLKLEEQGVAFSDTLVVGRTFNGADFLRRILSVRSVGRLYWESLAELNDPAEASTAVTRSSQ